MSDPQERAWYDKHREAIIRGGFGDDYQDDAVNIMPYFSSSAYGGYDDSDTGFYSVYADVFRKITEEDKRYKEAGDSDYEVPDFGNSKSDYEEVVKPFYDYWQTYFTSRSFIWVEEYDTREAENRRVSRLMEKENKKKRDAAKKEWNEKVRQLVSFVRKRDKRVQARKKQMEEIAAEKAKQHAERLEKQRIDRAKQVHEYASKGQKVMGELEADFQQLERDMAEEFGHSLSEESENSEDLSENGDVDDLYCVACNKAFRSQKAFINHENSKKHKENVAVLRQELENEENQMRDECQEDEDKDIEDEDTAAGLEETEDKPKLSKKQKKKRRQQKRMQDALDEEDDKEVPETFSLASNQEELAANLAEKLHLEKSDSRNGEPEDASNIPDSDVCDGDKRLGEQNIEKDAERIEDADSIRKPKSKGKKNKSNQPTSKQTAVSSNQDVFLCNVCHREYPTRNKLFNHIKSTGHALRVTTDEISRIQNTQENNGKKGKKKGKKKRGQTDEME